jgi:Rod binding domain-containing protein
LRNWGIEGFEAYRSKDMPNGIVSSLSNTPNNVNAAEKKRLKKACNDFEAMFIANMLKEMRKSIPKSGFLESSSGSDIYRSMMDQKVAEKIANDKGLGIGEMLFKQLRRYNSQDQ